MNRNQNISNGKMYRELSKPFASNDDAQEKISAFFKGVGELREKHKIPDVAIVTKASMVLNPGELDSVEGEFFSICYYGDQLNAPELHAYALGLTTKERSDRLKMFIAGNMTKSTE